MLGKSGAAGLVWGRAESLRLAAAVQNQAPYLWPLWHSTLSLPSLDKQAIVNLLYRF